MKIAYNPLKRKDGTTVGALTSAPNDLNITFDLPGNNIYARGVLFKGTDHTYTFSHDTNITLTTTATANDETNVEIGANISNLRKAIANDWDISVDKASFSLGTTWEDSGVSLSGLDSGIYAIHINYSGICYAGIFTMCSGDINTDDEIMLHECGAITLNRGRAFAKIKAGSDNKAHLYLALSKAESNITKFSIKIKAIGLI